MGMETIAIVLLVLFTLEIIFIFIYSSQKDDDDESDTAARTDGGWGPPELPRPPPSNIFEFPGGFPGGRPGGRGGGGRRQRWDDDDDEDYDFDGDFKKKDKITRVDFFLVDNRDDLNSPTRQTVDSDFRAHSDNKEYTVKLDKIDYDKFKDKKLFIQYKPRNLEVEWKLKNNDDNNKKSGWKNSNDGNINLGKLSKLKDQASGKDLILKIRTVDDN